MDMDQVRSAVHSSLSFAQVSRILGKKGSSTQQRIKSFCIQHAIDFSHFTGQAHKTPQQKVSFKEGSKKVSTSVLKRRLFDSGVPRICQECGLMEWLGKPIPLELHHKDGDKTNNHLSNLKILCSNCHAQTDSYCKRKKYRQVIS